MHTDLNPFLDDLLSPDAPDLDALTRRLSEVLHVGRVSVWRLEPDRRGLRCESLWHAGEHSRGAYLPLDAVPAYVDALRRQRIVAIEDVTTDPHTADLVEPYLAPLGIGAMLDAPITIDGALAGVVCHEHLGGPRGWTDEEQELSRTLARLLGLRWQAHQPDEAHRLLEQQAAQATLAMEAASAAHWSWDIQRDTVTWSGGVAAIFGHPPGWTPAGVEGFLQLVHPDDQASVQETLGAAMQQGERYYVAHRVLRADGRESWVEGRGRVFRGLVGEPVRIVGIVADVTERRALQDRLARTERLESLGRLAGGVAHDFNNLLTTIGASAALLQEAWMPARQAELVEGILDAADRAGDLTRQLLAFGHRQPQPETAVDAARVTLELASLLDRVLGAQVQLHVHAPEAAWVRAETAQLQQLLTNLAINGRDAMPSGGDLHLSLQAADAGVVLTVEDSGKGISPEVLPHIFEPFYTTKRAGTGLGLAVCHNVVEQLGGRIAVQSTPGEGTVFTVTLPHLAPPDEPKGPPPDARTMARGSGQILVVEDEDAVARVLLLALKRAGYQPERAATGPKAIERLRTGPKPDVLLCDIVLPGCSGVDVVREALALHPGLPTLVMTGYAPDGLPSDLAAIPILTKPFGPAVLLQKLLETLRGTPT